MLHRNSYFDSLVVFYRQSVAQTMKLVKSSRRSSKNDICFYVKRNAPSLLRSIFQDNEYTDSIISEIISLAYRVTKISILASMAMLEASMAVLDKVNQAYEQSNWSFFQQVATNAVRNAFQSILEQHADSDVICDYFKQLIVQHCTTPNTRHYGNILKFQETTYETNFTNNVALFKWS